MSKDPNNNTPANGVWPSLTTFTYGPGASSLGIGLGSFQSLNPPADAFPITDHRLYINGVASSQTLESLAGAAWTGSAFGRNPYLRIDAGSGETITSVGFENILSSSIGRIDDVLLFDHLAIQAVSQATPQPVPEPSSVVLFSLGVLGLVGYIWRSRERAAA